MQNSMEELFGIVNVLDPNKYDDEDEFLERFGKGMPTLEQVQDLQVGSHFFKHGSQILSRDELRQTQHIQLLPPVWLAWVHEVPLENQLHFCIACSCNP